jgi:hypothetical protein
LQQTLHIAATRLPKLTGACKMNERIRELYDQALVLEGNGDYTAGELDPEKFAELIVQECARIAWYNTPDSEELDYSHLIENEIKKHFGVE